MNPKFLYELMFTIIAMEKENHLQKLLGRGYVNSKDGKCMSMAPFFSFD